MSVSAERRLGDRIARDIYRDPDYVDDPVLDSYVQGLWQPLLAAARARGELSPELDERFAWQILLVRDRSVNAFALPGGYLGIHLGLIGMVGGRDELASVMAHELSHVTQRHISRLLSKQNQMTPWMMGALVLAAIAARGNAELANAALVGGQAVAIQNQLNFSRDMEREADRVGFGVMTQAGFEGQGLVTMFDRLQQANRLNDTGAFPYLRSHPLTTERIGDAQARLQLSQPPATTPAPDLEAALMGARARVLADPAVDSLRSWVSGGQASKVDGLPPHRQAAALYAAALAGSRLHEAAATRDALARLSALTLADARAARLVTWLAAELALASGDSGRAVKLLDADTNRRPAVLLLSQALTQAGQPGPAAARLQTWVTLHPGDATAWQLLSSAHAAAGRTLAGIRASAEARAAQLDYVAALDRLKAGQEQVRRGRDTEHFEASIIDSRARSLESLAREQALER